MRESLRLLLTKSRFSLEPLCPWFSVSSFIEQVFLDDPTHMTTARVRESLNFCAGTYSVCACPQVFGLGMTFLGGRTGVTDGGPTLIPLNMINPEMK